MTPFLFLLLGHVWNAGINNNNGKKSITFPFINVFGLFFRIRIEINKKLLTWKPNLTLTRILIPFFYKLI